ncbi:NAD(P)H-binding protein [Thermoactinospora rubra]|uniref:NAD(P)H-binding protein n=1 Tax=Thermoactinospora rubra TaxID=1088767 RepID=UPI000A11A856|nr:NAD(P)H-binding protein [Thermoactinospora rubra]
MTILVTGATGTVGRHVVRELLDRGATVRALTRDPATADLPAGVEVVRGDLTRADTLAPALEGVTGVHLIDAADDDYTTLPNGEEIVKLLDGRKVTLLSAMGPGTLEPALRASDLEWTYVQPTEFMSNALEWSEPVRAHGRIEEAFPRTKTCMVHEADIGAVIATVLTSDGHAGQTYGLTGPERLDVYDKARILGAATGREIEVVELTLDDLRARGVPQQYLEFLSMAFDVPEDAYQVVDTVERVTGRAPRTFAQWAEEHAPAFK